MVSKGTGGDTTRNNTLEYDVCNLFKNTYNFSIEKHSIFKNNESQYNDVIVKNVPYKSIYENNGRTEFSLKSTTYPTLNNTRIECKFQEKSGSTQDKISYFTDNALFDRFPEKNLLLVLGGDKLEKITDICRKLHCKRISNIDKTLLIVKYTDLRNIITTLTTIDPQTGKYTTFKDLLQHC
ncbi:MAG: hypothetical protein H8D97_01355 [Proteobacteria bacterium]|nr:hypothetical protein [Pseudomonadota bacterium]